MADRLQYHRLLLQLPSSTFLMKLLGPAIGATSLQRGGFGDVVLAGLVTFVMHFGTIEIFVATFRRANCGWLATAESFQLAT